MFNDLLADLDVAQTRLILTDSPIGLLNRLEDDAPTDRQLVGCVWDRLPVLDSLRRDTLTALAQTAMSCWPRWYFNVPDQRFGVEQNDATDTDQFLSREALRAARVPVVEPWLRAAIRCCRDSRLPTPNGFADAVHAAQLALAIDPSKLLLLLVVTSPEPADERLDGLARTAEWLARTTAAPVAVIVPASLVGNTSLDNISFGAVRVDLDPPANSNMSPQSQVETASSVATPAS